MCDFPYGFWISPDGERIPVPSMRHTDVGRKIINERGLVNSQGDSFGSYDTMMYNGYIRVITLDHFTAELDDLYARGGSLTAKSRKAVIELMNEYMKCNPDAEIYLSRRMETARAAAALIRKGKSYEDFRYRSRSEESLTRPENVTLFR